MAYKMHFNHFDFIQPFHRLKMPPFAGSIRSFTKKFQWFNFIMRAKNQMAKTAKLAENFNQFMNCTDFLKQRHCS